MNATQSERSSSDSVQLIESNANPVVLSAEKYLIAIMQAMLRDFSNEATKQLVDSFPFVSRYQSIDLNYALFT